MGCVQLLAALPPTLTSRPHLQVVSQRCTSIPELRTALSAIVVSTQGCLLHRLANFWRLPAPFCASLWLPAHPRSFQCVPAPPCASPGCLPALRSASLRLPALVYACPRPPVPAPTARPQGCAQQPQTLGQPWPLRSGAAYGCEPARDCRQHGRAGRSRASVHACTGFRSAARTS